MNYKALLLLLGLFTITASPSKSQITDGVIDSIRKSFYIAANADSSKKALDINEQLSAYYLESKDSLEWIRTQVHKAEILRANADLESAINVINKAEEITRKLPATTVKSTFYNRKAAILFELKEHESSLKAVKASQRIDSIKNFKWRIISNLVLEAAIYREFGQTKKSEKTLKQIIKKATNPEDESDYLLAIYNLAFVYYNDNNYQKAIKASSRYLSHDSLKTESLKRGDMFHVKAMCYRNLKIYDSAFVNLDRAHAIRLIEMDKLIDHNANATKQASDLAYEKEQKKRLETENKAARQQVVILVLAFALMFIVAFIVNRRRRYYKELKNKQDKLNNQLKSTGEFKTKLVGILAHDVRNPMNAIIGMFHIYNSGGIEKEMLDKFMLSLQTSAQNVNFLLEDILSWVKTQGNSFKVTKTETQLGSILSSIKPEVNPLLKAKDIELNESNFDQQKPINTDSDVLKLVIRNIVTNAIKYSKQKSSIKIDSEFANNQHFIRIIDHGVGMNHETLNKVLNQTKVSSLGTNNEKGTGMGLPLVFELTKELGGNVTIDSEPEQGTTVTLILPK
ncbi:MAG: HAMP domain-containing histidine kinase [Bacteroidia bacterium]